MERLNMHRPGYGYYEDEKVIRGPVDSYSSEYRVEEYTNPGYGLGRHHDAEYVEKVTEVRYDDTPSYRHHHHHFPGVGAEYVERKEKIIYENDHDPYRRLY